MKICLSLLILLINILGAYGQSKKTEDPVLLITREESVELQRRPLIIPLTGYTQLDKDLEFVFRKFWTINPEIYFYDPVTIERKLREKPSGYTILAFNRVIHTKVEEGKIPDGCTYWVRASLKYSEKYDRKIPAHFHDMIASIEDKELIVYRKELIYTARCIQNFLIAKLSQEKRTLTGVDDFMKNQGLLSQKTLLVDKRYFNDAYTPEQMVVDYPHKFKVVSREEIEKAQIESNKECAYLELIPLEDTNYLYHTIIDCEDGETLSHGEYVFRMKGNKFPNFINKYHVESYYKYGDYEKYGKTKKKN